MVLLRHLTKGSLSEGQQLAGCEDLQRAAGGERSERTPSVPSVVSRRVAAPYGVDGRFGTANLTSD